MKPIIFNDLLADTLYQFSPYNYFKLLKEFDTQKNNKFSVVEKELEREFYDYLKGYNRLSTREQNILSYNVMFSFLPYYITLSKDKKLTVLAKYIVQLRDDNNRITEDFMELFSDLINQFPISVEQAKQLFGDDYYNYMYDKDVLRLITTDNNYDYLDDFLEYHLENRLASYLDGGLDSERHTSQDVVLYFDIVPTLYNQINSLHVKNIFYKLSNFINDLISNGNYVTGDISFQANSEIYSNFLPKIDTTISHKVVLNNYTKFNQYPNQFPVNYFLNGIECYRIQDTIECPKSLSTHYTSEYPILALGYSQQRFVDDYSNVFEKNDSYLDYLKTYYELFNNQPDLLEQLPFTFQGEVKSYSIIN